MEYYTKTTPDAILFDTSDFVLKEEGGEAVARLQQITTESRGAGKDLALYRKYVPKLIKLFLQQQALIDGYQKTYDRYLTDSEEHKYKRWSKDEDELLIEMVCGNEKSLLEISTTLGRTPGAIKTRLSNLVGMKRISQKIAGRFIGIVNGDQKDCNINGIIYKEA